MQSYSILLVEDDKRLAELVKNYLEAQGYIVHTEDHGNRVPRQVKLISPSLIILDVMLPGKDGLTLCKEIREDFRGPILMLTARNEDSDQILGLENGADDYVVKPVEPPVLVARIRALLRRYYATEAEQDQPVQFGSLIISPSARQVVLANDVVALSSHEFDLLLVLAKAAGQVVSRESLFNQIYHREYDGLDRSIDVRISQLRKKLFDSAENPVRIKTIWGRGYLFIADAWEEKFPC